MLAPSSRWAGLARSLLAATVLATLPALVSASTLSLHPTRLYLQADSSESLVVKNRGDYPILIQARVMAWSDSAGEDLLEPSDDLIAWPPIVEVEGKAQQVIRVAPNGRSSGEVEASYRLLVSEVPRGRVESSIPGVRFALQFSLPVFVRQAESAQPSLAWSLERLEDHGLIVWATNHGTAHARILGVAVSGTDAPEWSARVDEPRYLLPGARRSWRLETQAAGRLAGSRSLTITADTDGGALTAVVGIPESGVPPASSAELPATR